MFTNYLNAKKAADESKKFNPKFIYVCCNLKGELKFFENAKGSPRFLATIRQKRTLKACAITVARAAPLAAMWKTATKRRSPKMLIMQATKTVRSGVFESPIPRKTPPIIL